MKGYRTVPDGFIRERMERAAATGNLLLSERYGDGPEDDDDDVDDDDVEDDEDD